MNVIAVSCVCSITTGTNNFVQKYLVVSEKLQFSYTHVLRFKLWMQKSQIQYMILYLHVHLQPLPSPNSTSD